MRKVYYFNSEGKVIDRPDSGASGPKLHFIQDSMDACRHPATGIWCDSKSEFRKMTRASGCVEVGDQDTSSMRRNREKMESAKQDLIRFYRG